VAALYDIHGNLPALDAVLEDVRRERVDLVMLGGDVLPGPMPAETLDRLAAFDLPVRCIHGNGERVVLAAIGGGDVSEVPEGYRHLIHWTAQRVTESHRAWMSDWPLTCRIAIDGIGDVLFCHATPRNDVDCFTRTTADERLAPAFAGVAAPLVVCGHTHMPFDRRVGSTRVVNAGSVGMPFCRPRGAYWLLVGPDIELRRTDYDYEGAAQKIRQTGFPMVEGLAVQYVLNPPAEADSLQLFAKAELS
jgi:predicted phosphodiesterase